MKRMNSTMAVLAGLMLAGSVLSAKETTLTGKVGDAMCGAKHMMPNDEAACTAACAKKGSDYALIVNDKVYTLKVAKDSVKADLAKLAGKSAKITGDQNGDTIQVSAVAAAAAAH